MKIVIISNYRLGNETGVAKVSEVLSQKLSEKNEVLYLCLGEKFEKVSPSKNLILFKIPSVPIKQGYIPKLTSNTYQEIMSTLDDFNPEVIHAQNIVFASLVALIWAVQNNTPFITTFHSMPSEGITWVYPKLSGKKSAEILNYTFKSGYVKRFLKHVDLAIALNNFVEKSIKDVYRKTNTLIVNNGLKLDQYFKLKTNKPGNKVHFIYLGTYMPKKNQEYLIKAFSFLPKNYILDLYGNKNSGNAYVAKLEKLRKRLKVQNVNLNDFISSNEVLSKLESTNFLVSASLKEAQSLVVIESLASGNPVIGLANETIDEVIDNKNGLKLPQKTSPKEFAENVVKFVTNVDYTKTSNHARNSAKRFDINLVSDELTKVYKDQISKKSKRETVKNNILEDLIPDAFKDIFNDLTKTKRTKSLRLKYFLFLTMILSFIAWPILQLTQLVSKKITDKKSTKNTK